MNQNEITTRGALNDLQLTQLVDQLDPAIGEATSVMGALTSEIIRRALRGGVMELGRELNGYVGGLVESQIIKQRPAIDKAATETATEVARAEVETVRQTVSEQGEQLAARIEQTAREVHQASQEQGQQLAARIDTTAQTVSRELSSRLEETSRQTHEKVVAIAGDLSGRLETTASMTKALESEVAAADARTLDTARQEFTEQLEAVRAKSRQTAGKINERLDKLDAVSAELAELQRTQREDMLRALRTERDSLVQQIEQMAARLEDLEKPRGLRALFSWLFGKKKKKVASPKVDTSKDGDAAFSDSKAEV